MPLKTLLPVRLLDLKVEQSLDMVNGRYPAC